MKNFAMRFAIFVILAFPLCLWADAPRAWQLGFQDAATEIMELTAQSHELVMWIMTAIVVAVWGVMAYTIVKFRRKKGSEVVNKASVNNSNHAIIEVLWTVIPLIVVGFLTVGNVRLIRKQERMPEIDMTLKVVGYQWYWGYSYPDHGGISFDSYMKPDNELQPGDLRLLTVDNRVVLPVGKNVRVQITGADVIHSFAVPSFGIKVDAIPGRLNEVWFNIKKPGVYYGQCSELCGRLHGFMPIVIEAVTEGDFEKWVKSQKA